MAKLMIIFVLLILLTGCGQKTEKLDPEEVSGQEIDMVDETVDIVIVDEEMADDNIDDNEIGYDNYDEEIIFEDRCAGAAKGLVILRPQGGSTISHTKRISMWSAIRYADTLLPVQGFEFIIHRVEDEVILKIELPLSALDPDGNFSFIDKDGNMKRELSWYKIIDYEWVKLPEVKVGYNQKAAVIEATLKDGGLEDDDGQVNGEIVVLGGAPGVDCI
ncbi:MAG: choice-of-anchor U domain-containing protein [Nanoarchaeota archaeon]